jgi:hypothetical protein
LRRYWFIVRDIAIGTTTADEAFPETEKDLSGVVCHLYLKLMLNSQNIRLHKKRT